jgi:hypothetical protein
MARVNLPSHNEKHMINRSDLGEAQGAPDLETK